MTGSRYAKDLAVMVADRHIEATVAGLLDERLDELGVRALDYGLIRHPGNDPGVYRHPEDLLRAVNRDYACAIAIFDYQGSEAREKSAPGAAAAVQKLLEQNGWKDRSTAVCIQPELERWVVSACHQFVRHYDLTLADMTDVLEAAGHVAGDGGKYHEPKEAHEVVLRATGETKSSADFRALATKLPIRKCTDPAFSALVRFLREHFPAH